VSRISGPLLDRIDIHVEVPAVKYAELSSKRSGEPSSAIRTLVTMAHAYDGILKVARTIADLSASPDIMPEHIAEAMQYRSLDRQLYMEA